MLMSGLLHWLTNEQGLISLLAHNWLLGIALIAMIIFMETGLVFLPFLPGDSLLFATGAFLGVAGLSPIVPIAIVALAAIAGDTLNFTFGRSWIGTWLLHKKWIKPAHLEKTQDYFNVWGGITITLGRFIPIVRTIAPFMAGLSGMTPARFTMFNAVGGIIWTTGLISAGYWLCQVSWIKNNLSALSLTIVILSLSPILVRLLPKFRKQPAEVQ